MKMDLHLASTEQGSPGGDPVADAGRNLGEIRGRLTDIAGRLGDLARRLGELTGGRDPRDSQGRSDRGDLPGSGPWSPT